MLYNYIMVKNIYPIGVLPRSLIYSSNGKNKYIGNSKVNNIKYIEYINKNITNSYTSNNIGANSIFVRRYKNNKARVCSKNNCFSGYNFLGIKNYVYI